MKRYKSKKAFGKAGEKFAADYLVKKGLTILETNYRVREGEIDLIALDGEVIIFIEVKSRYSDKCDLPIMAIDEKKQEKIRRVAEIYLAGKGWMEREVSFDAFTIRFDKTRKKWIVRWIRQAF